MRTLTQMREKIRRLVQDAGAYEFADSDIDLVFSEACEVFGRDLVRTDGRRIMRLIGTATDLVADEEEYSLPSDCLHVDQVEFRARDSDERWFPIPRRNPIDSTSGQVRWGTSDILESPGMFTPGLNWYDDTATDKIRIWPSMSNIVEQKFRIRYFHMIVMPTDDAGTLNNPADAASDLYLLPELAASAVEYLTAAILSYEDLEDPKPISAYHQKYGMILRLLGNTGDRSPAKRRYINSNRI